MYGAVFYCEENNCKKKKNGKSVADLKKFGKIGGVKI
jgi:hypothetical protein